MTLERERLASFVEHLRQSYETVRADLASTHPDVEPERIQTMDGRYILLDALTALVNGQAVLDS